jgi:predicted nucleic acid-binding protein
MTSSAVVLDVSVIMAWLMPDEATESTRTMQARMAGVTALVPALWKIEIGNSLLMAARRGRINHAQRSAILHLVARLPVRVDKFTQRQLFTHTLALADRHGLTLCDAAYLELAVRMGVALLTYDTLLQKAARAEGVLYT